MGPRLWDHNKAWVLSRGIIRGQCTWTYMKRITCPGMYVFTVHAKQLRLLIIHKKMSQHLIIVCTNCQTAIENSV